MQIHDHMRSYIRKNIHGVADACILNWDLHKNEYRQYGANKNFFGDFHERGLIRDCARMISAKMSVVDNSVSRDHHAKLGLQDTHHTIAITTAHADGYDEGIFVVDKAVPVSFELFNELSQHTAIMCHAAAQCRAQGDIPHHETVIAQHVRDISRRSESLSGAHYRCGNISLTHSELTALRMYLRDASYAAIASAIGVDESRAADIVQQVSRMLYAVDKSELHDRVDAHGFSMIAGMH